MPFQTSHGDSRPSPGLNTEGGPSPDLQIGPDDLVFRQVFGTAENVVSRLRAAVTPYEADQLDFGKLTRVSATFIDDDLKDRYSDLLFAVPFAGQYDAYMYVLVEDQVSDNPRVFEHLERFELRICDRYQAENLQAWRLPMIIPLIVNWGSDGLPEFQSLEDLLGPDLGIRRLVEEVRAGNPDTIKALREELEEPLFASVFRTANARIEAMAPAKARDLVEVLETRFGPLPENLPRLISEYSIANLEKWRARAGTAATSHEVFFG